MGKKPAHVSVNAIASSSMCTNLVHRVELLDVHRGRIVDVDHLVLSLVVVVVELVAAE